MNKYYSEGEWDFVEVQIAGTHYLMLDTGNLLSAINPGSVALSLEKLVHDGYEIDRLPNPNNFPGEIADVSRDGENWWIRLRKRK